MLQNPDNLNSSVEDFKAKLDDHHHWPSLYMFKFIVPKGKEGEIFKLFKANEITTKLSKAGNYIGVTAKVIMQSSDDVIKIYNKAWKVEGVISL